MLIEIAPDMFPCLGSLELATLLGPLPFCEFGGLALVGPGDQTSPFCGGVGRSKLGSFALHIYLKLHSSNCSGNNAQQIVLDKIN